MVQHVRVFGVLQIRIVDVLVQLPRRHLSLRCQFQVGLGSVANGALPLLTTGLSNDKLGLSRRITLDLRDLLQGCLLGKINLRPVVGCLLLLHLCLLLLAGHLSLDQRVLTGH